ncbi:MAG: M1 family peptidase, partial [Maribacter sp.]|nr:M1 family peptidase [Maribacter sp.]
LRTTLIPVFEYEIDGKRLKYRYTQVVPDFKMPIRVTIGNEMYWLTPNDTWQTQEFRTELSSLEVDMNFYLEVLETK